MGDHDLHWYVNPKNRKKGYLFNNMKQTILPHLFSNRKVQSISIDRNRIGEQNFINSERVALLLGFTKVDESHYSLSKKKYSNFLVPEINEGLSYDEMDRLRMKLFNISQTLWAIQSELEMKYGNTKLSRELFTLKDQIAKKYWSLEDLWYEKKDNINKI